MRCWLNKHGESRIPPSLIFRGRRAGKFGMMIIVLALTLVSTSAHAIQMYPGFYEGPYLRFVGGLLYSDFDTNIRTGDPNADRHEGTVGFQFGWNLWDCAAPELEVIYSAAKIRDKREHKVAVGANLKYSFIVDALLISEGFQILPYVKGGPAAFIGVVPSDPLATANMMTAWGVGFGGGGGIDFLIKKYIYTSIGVQGAGYYMPAVYQNLAGINTKVLAGGWQPFLAVLGSIGVHF